MALEKPNLLDIVRPTDEAWVFEVRSRTNPEEWYQVYPLYNGGIGLCTCPHHSFKIGKRISSGATIWDEGTTCWHIDQLHKYLIRQVLIRESKQQRNKHDHK